MTQDHPPSYMTRVRLFWEAADAFLKRRGRSPLSYEQARLLFDAEVEPEDVLGARARAPVSRIPIEGKLPPAANQTLTGDL